MKKIFLLIVGLMIVVPKIFSQVEKSQSVNLEILGLQYNCEIPLSSKFTINCHAGLMNELGYSTSDWVDSDGWFTL